MRKISHTINKILSICLLILIFLPGCSQVRELINPASAAPFPRSTPEEQGMDSQVLLEMLNFLEKGKYNIHSILVLRNGNLVLEVYFPPFGPQDKHMLFSATKSFVSALVGIAIHEGKIGSVDQLMLDTFQDDKIKNLDERKQNIRILDLLNMTSGLLADDMAMGESADWAQFTLDQPMDFEPGAYMDYNSGNSQLLAEIVERATGKPAAQYAQEMLFEPLGIKDVYWQNDPSGATEGGVGLMLAPRDMAKFGLLYLNQGQWEGNQIVPAEWITASTQKNENAYAYQWWQVGDSYVAEGWGGQYIFVNPQQGLVLVFTSALPINSMFLGEFLADQMISQAVKSEQPLPESPASKELEEKVKAIANPVVKELPELPTMAEAVNGETLHLDDNPLGWQTARLDFEGDHAWLTVTTAASPGEQKFAIGLDGVYRMTELAKVEEMSLPEPEQRNFLNPYEFNFLLGMPVDGAVAMKGDWTREDWFTLTVQDTRDFDREIIKFYYSPPVGQIEWLSEMDQIYMRLSGKFE